ncbi:flavin reductase family protein [bacterium]|nr:flavin reductase family protein [bacterium]
MKIHIGPKTVIHPHPVLIIATYSKEGNANMMNAAWGGICCSDPPAVAVALREATLTYHNIIASEAFTVNIPSVDHVREADYAGIASGHEIDKFHVTGLTPVKSEVVNAPYIKEFPFALECKLLKSVKIGLHTQFIGEIIDVIADEDVLNEKGWPSIEKTRAILYGSFGSRAYYSVGENVGKAFSIGKELQG